MLDLALAGALPYGLQEPVRRQLARRESPAWLRADAARSVLDDRRPARLEAARRAALVGATSLTGSRGESRRSASSSTSAGERPPRALSPATRSSTSISSSSPSASLRAATFDRFRSRPVLRASMDGLLPDSVRLRPEKAWFDSMIIDCLTGPDGAAARSLSDLAAGRAARIRGPRRARARDSSQAGPAGRARRSGGSGRSGGSSQPRSGCNPSQTRAARRSARPCGAKPSPRGTCERSPPGPTTPD